MVVLDVKGSNSEKMITETKPISAVHQEEGSEEVRTCENCGTSKTPLWRRGPGGPKTLCNACGLKTTKKRKASPALKKDAKKSKEKPTDMNAANVFIEDEFAESSRKGQVALESNEVAKKPRSPKSQGRKMTEEEQAALLLMTLSL